VIDYLRKDNMILSLIFKMTVELRDCYHLTKETMP